MRIKRLTRLEGLPAYSGHEAGFHRFTILIRDCPQFSLNHTEHSSSFLPTHGWPHCSWPQGSLHTMSSGDLEQGTLLIWPQEEAFFSTIFVHLNADGSWEQGTCCSCSHSGIIFFTFSMQGPHGWLQILWHLCPQEAFVSTIFIHMNVDGSWEQGTRCSCWHSGIIFFTFTMQRPHGWPQILWHLCPRSHKILEQGCWQANWSLCSRSKGWQGCLQMWPHVSFISHCFEQPPSGAFSKSSGVDAKIIFSGWFWQESFSSLPMLPCSCISAKMFLHRSLLRANSVAFPMMKKPLRARDNATQTLFAIFRKPILSLRTSDRRMMSFSSPWKLSTTVTRTPSKNFFAFEIAMFDITCFSWKSCPL